MASEPVVARCRTVTLSAPLPHTVAPRGGFSRFQSCILSIAARPNTSVHSANIASMHTVHARTHARGRSHALARTPRSPRHARTPRTHATHARHARTPRTHARASYGPMLHKPSPCVSQAGGYDLMRDPMAILSSDCPRLANASSTAEEEEVPLHFGRGHAPNMACAPNVACTSLIWHAQP
jgi:hypothetical protein